MGFSTPKRTRHIVFEAGSDYDGLEIEAHGITVDEYMHGMQDVTEQFLAKVISWNWETPIGVPVHPALPVGAQRADESKDQYEARKSAAEPPEGHVDAGALDQQDLRNVATWWVREVTGLRPLALQGTTRRAVLNGQLEAELPMTPIKDG